MIEDLTRLLEALRQAQDFETGAEALLAPLLETTRQAMADHPRGRRGELLRGWVHRRGERSYQALHGVEIGADDRGPPGPSASAWRLVQATGAAVVVDVEAQRVLHPSGQPLEADKAWAGATRARLQARQTTHLLALPLRGQGDRVEGLVALELRCAVAVGTRLDLWAPHAAPFQLLCDVAVPILRHLPPATTPSGLTDDLLPVVGPTMAPVVRMLAVFATYDAPMLLRGSTGTGKTSIARWAHARSTRKDGPFEVVALHAVAETLRVGELFGWKRGAFTGAERNHDGCVTRARGGTLFLDEVDKLDLDTQAKLLGLLEDGTYRPLGDPRTRRADVRFVIGTNADLEGEVRAGRFLQDLYFRIHVLPVELPDLRDRADEISDWAAWMLAQMDLPGRGHAGLASEALSVLEVFDWPGNLRQLHSVVVRATALATLAGGSQDLLTEEAIRRSLALESAGPEGGPLEVMARAAEAYVRAARRIAAEGGDPLSLDHADAFRGLVLSAATRLVGGEREAFELFGLAAQLRHGNHLKTLRRELNRVEQLRELLAPGTGAGD